METFNIKRFGYVCSRLVLIRKKEYMNYFLGLMLGYAFACIAVANPFKFEALTDDIYKIVLPCKWIYDSCYHHYSRSLRLNDNQRLENEAAKNRRTHVSCHQFREVYGTFPWVYPLFSSAYSSGFLRCRCFTNAH